MHYPSAPLLLVAWTAPRFPACRVLTRTTADVQKVLATAPAVIRIQRSGGARKYLLDQASIDVDVFAQKFEDADQFCDLVCNDWELVMPGAHIDAAEHGRATVSLVDITSGPSQRPVSDTALTRVGATARIVLKSL